MHQLLTIAAAALGLAAAAAPQASAETAPAPAAATPAYIEFTVRDLARTKAFYGAVFGWRFTDYGPAYASFSTHGADGGFTQGAPGGGGGPLMVFPTDDLEGAQARVVAAGGTVTKPIFSFPGGRRFHFRDLDGYDVAAWTAH